MPTYTFRRHSTKEEWTEVMSIATMEQLLSEDPDLETVPGNFLYGDPVSLGHQKPPERFRELLRHIKKNNIRSTIETY